MPTYTTSGFMAVPRVIANEMKNFSKALHSRLVIKRQIGDMGTRSYLVIAALAIALQYVDAFPPSSNVAVSAEDVGGYVFDPQALTLFKNDSYTKENEGGMTNVDEYHYQKGVPGDFSQQIQLAFDNRYEFVGVQEAGGKTYAVLRDRATYQEVFQEINLPVAPPIKLPRPDDIKFDGSSISINSDVYQYVGETWRPKGRLELKLKIKQRPGPNGSKYQVFFSDPSPDAEIETIDRVIQLPYEPVKLPRPNDLFVDNDTQLHINKQVYHLQNWTIDWAKNVAIVNLRLRMRKAPNGTEYQVFLDDEEPGDYEKTIVQEVPLPEGLQPPTKPSPPPPTKPPQNIRPGQIEIRPNLTITYDNIRYRFVNFTVDSSGHHIFTLQKKIRQGPNGSFYEVPWSDNSPGATIHTVSQKVPLHVVQSNIQTSRETIKLTSNGILGIDTNKFMPQGINLTSRGYVITGTGPAENHEEPDYEDEGVIQITTTNVPVENFTIPPHKLQPDEQLVGSVLHPNGSQTILYIFRVLVHPNGTTERIRVELQQPGSSLHVGLGMYINPELAKTCARLANGTSPPELLNVPSYKTVNETSNPDGSTTIYAKIRIYGPIRGGPNYVIPYLPAREDSEVWGAKIVIDSKGNAKIVDAWPLVSPDQNTTPRPGGTNSGRNPGNSLTILNLIWWKQVKPQRPGQPVIVIVQTKPNSDGSHLVVPLNPNPSERIPPPTVCVFPPGTNGISTCQIPNNVTDGTSTENAGNSHGQNGSGQTSARPDIYNIPSYKQINTTEENSDGSKTIYAHIRVHQPVANGPWYTVKFGSKPPNSEKLLAKIVVDPQGVARIVSTACLSPEKAETSLCKGGTSAGEKPKGKIDIENEPWFRIVDSGPDPNDPTKNRTVIEINQGKNPDGSASVLPLNQNTAGASLNVGFLEDRGENNNVKTYTPGVSGPNSGQKPRGGDSGEDPGKWTTDPPDIIDYNDHDTTPSDGENDYSTTKSGTDIGDYNNHETMPSDGENHYRTTESGTDIGDYNNHETMPSDGENHYRTTESGTDIGDYNNHDTMPSGDESHQSMTPPPDMMYY